MRLLSLLAVAALVLAGCGSDSDETVATVTTPPAATTDSFTITELPPTTPPDTTPEGEGACSMSGLRLTLPEQDLPPEVADVRKRVFDAAAACDYDTLEQIAEEQGEGFTFSYGSGGDASDYWREVEETSTETPKPMRALATILTMPFTRNESGSYAWPTAYSENPTDEAWRDLVYKGLYGAEVVDRMREQNTGYLGYRTAVTADGDWQFFVAGD
ncbi:MAG: hypothetical protein HOQ03_01610 [Thermoleophilia bacterium]|nr:hypothetical protein [Thermoleophilia bacterium]